MSLQIKKNIKMCNKNYKWFLIDANNQIVGRLSSYITKYLIGKNKIEYLPNYLNNDFFIIINTDKLIFSANKFKKKIYYKHTGYIGGLKSITAKKQLEKDSRKIIFLAIKGMLPKNKIGKKILTHIKFYKNEFHEHIAQKPKILKF